MSQLTSQLVIELLDRVTAPARRVGGALAGIGDRIRETNGAAAGFGDRLNAAMTRNNRALANARAGLVDAVGGFYLLRSALGAPLQAAGEFEDVMTRITRVADFGSVEGLAQFRQELFSLSREVPLTIQELGGIAAAAGEAGFAAEGLLQVTRDAAVAAVAFGSSAEETGQMLAAMRQSYGMSRDEAMGLVDAMNALSNSMASSAPELSDFWTRIAADAGQAGFSQEEAVALGSAMIASGHGADVAATSFRNMALALTRGESATARQSAAFEQLGLDAGDVAVRMQQDAVATTRDVLARLAALPAETRNAVRADLFGTEARALGSIATNLDFFDRALATVADRSEYAGSATAEYERQLGTFGATLTRLRNIIFELQNAIGEALIPALTSIVETVGPVITRIAELAAAYPEVTATVVGATAAVIAFRAGLAALRFAGLLGRGGVLSLISLGFNGITRSASAASAVIGQIRLQNALAGMAGSVGPLTRLGSALHVIGRVTGLGAVASGIGAVAGAIGAISAPVWLAIAAAVAAVGAAWRYWDRISAFLSGVGSAIADRLAPALEAIAPVLEPLRPIVEGVGSAFGTMVETIGGAIDRIREFLAGGIFQREVLSEEEAAQVAANAERWTNRMIDGFLGLPAALWQVGQDAIQSLWDGIVAKFDELVAWLRGMPGRIASAIGNIDLGSLIFGGAPEVVVAPTITPSPSSVLPRQGGDADMGAIQDYLDGTRARGGPISRGGNYLVGENGPELITASRSGYVHPTGQGGGGPVEIALTNHITVQGGGVDADTIAAQVVRRFEDSVSASLRGVFADIGVRLA